MLLSDALARVRELVHINIYLYICMYMCILCVRVFAAVVAGNVLLFSVVLFIRGWPYVGGAAMLVRVF